MKQKDLFNLAVRILGLVFLYSGLQPIPMVAGRFWEAFLSICYNQPQFQGLLMLTTMTAWQLVLAIWLISGAPWLMHRAYPEGTTSPTVGASGQPQGEKAA